MLREDSAYLCGEDHGFHDWMMFYFTSLVEKFRVVPLFRREQKFVYSLSNHVGHDFTSCCWKCKMWWNSDLLHRRIAASCGVIRFSSFICDVQSSFQDWGKSRSLFLQKAFNSHFRFRSQSQWICIFKFWRNWRIWLSNEPTNLNSGFNPFFCCFG